MHLTLQQVGEHLDMSAQAAMEFCHAKDIEWQTSTLDLIRVSYVRHMREIAAGRSALGDSALATQRARLAQEQADRVAMANARARRELAPVSSLERSLAAVSRQISAVLETIPVRVKRRIPDIQQQVLDAIGEEIVKARNIAAQAALELNDEDHDAGDSDRDPTGPAAA